MANLNHKLACAIAAILGSASVSTGHAADSSDSTVVQGLQEITVTAQRRSENLQDVPITIQALTSDTLKQLSLSTFDDVVRYLPNVQFAANGPGQGDIFMRGLATGSDGAQGTGTFGIYPNVALYLDDQSAQLPSRNLDIYAADLERIEILEGPQGTLFGGGAEAGVVRYITNKPKLNVTEGSVEASYGTTAHGENNSGGNAVINLPLVQDHLAARAVIYNENRGGYIDNVPSTFTRRDTDLGIYYANYINPSTGKLGVPPDSVAINNYSIAGRDINPVKYVGLRAQLLWQINDDWNVLLSQTYQNMRADGGYAQYPLSSENVPLQPLETTIFNNAYSKDKFTNTALTVTGKLGDYLKAVYTGGYLVRDVDQVNDYTNYARGVYADYYQCYGPGSGKYSAGHGYAIYGVGDPNLTSRCFSPSATWREIEKNKHTSHEIRLSTPEENRWRLIVGAFMESYRIYDQTDWGYRSLPACTSDGPAGTPGNTGCLSNVATGGGSNLTSPGMKDDNVAFFEDTQRGYKQTAFFASADFDIIPKVLTLTAGARHYRYKIAQTGWVTGSFGCFESGTAPCTYYGTNMDAENLASTYSGTKGRANLTWHITPDMMVYFTWSQGYRPGGFNRKGGSALPGTDGNPQLFKPLAFAPDSLNNTELGWKTEFFDHRIQINGSIYEEKWKNVQTSLFNPGVFGNLIFVTNGPDYRIRGLELQANAVVVPGLTVMAAGSWNKSEQMNSPLLISNNPASNNYGNPITDYVFRGQLTSALNPFGEAGGVTAFSPSAQWNLRARYDWAASEYKFFILGGVQHVGQMYSQVDNGTNGDAVVNVDTTALRYSIPARSSYDASAGVTRDNWNVQIFGQNLANSHASVFTSASQFIRAEVPMRPRVLGVKFGLKF